MSNLSPKQAAVLAFIQRFLQAHELPPTRGEIAEGLGLKNRQGIDQHLRALEAKGVLDLRPGISRGIRLHAQAPSVAIRGKARLENAGGPGLPLLGRIAAGSPILASGNVEDYVNVDAALFRPCAHFILRVRGDSMKDADILDRDLLAVHQTAQARNGQIVVVRLGDEATVKYYRRHGNGVRLEAANAAYRPIEVDLGTRDLTIEGLAVGVIRTALYRAR